MICDVHVHVAGVGTQRSGNFLAEKFRRGIACRLFLRSLGLPADFLEKPDCDQQIAGLLINRLSTSRVDRTVLLALDAAYHHDGTRDDARTLMVADNDFVAGLASANSKVRFGASVHPFRHDAFHELERLIAKGACLVKWLPGAQNIQPDHPRCFGFYDIMAKHRVPLLCHTGDEHTLKVFSDSLNDPRRLVPALDRGVIVIAAHCGTSLVPNNRGHFQAWMDLALKHENFYGDISALGVTTRIWSLRKVLRSPRLTAKCVYGSDLPVPPFPLSCVGMISLSQALAIRRLRNPFDQPIALMKAVGVPEEVFARGAQLLRI